MSVTMLAQLKLGPNRLGPTFSLSVKEMTDASAKQSKKRRKTECPEPEFAHATMKANGGDASMKANEVQRSSSCSSEVAKPQAMTADECERLGEGMKQMAMKADEGPDSGSTKGLAMQNRCNGRVKRLMAKSLRP